MGDSIVSGAGIEYAAEVDKNLMLRVASVNSERTAYVSIKTEESFLLASGFIILTSTGSFNGLSYVKNTSSKNFFVQRIRVCSTDMGHVQCILTANPAGGTLITDENTSFERSANMGSNETFANFGLSYCASGDGKTVIGGDQFSNFINHSPGHSIQDYEGALLLPKGASFALSAKPSVAMTICTEIQGWFE